MTALVSVPNLHWIHKHVVHVLLRLIIDGRFGVQIIMPSHKPYENNLHHIVNDFMSSEHDFWLNIDSDNPPRLNPLERMADDKDLIGFPTPVWHYTGKIKGERPIYWNGYKRNIHHDGYSEWEDKEGLQEVDAIGTGCFLVHRRVFENPEMRKAPFQRIYNEDGTVERGNDIAFCERVKKNGFRIWCDYDRPCNHFSELELNEINVAFNRVFSDV